VFFLLMERSTYLVSGFQILVTPERRCLAIDVVRFEALFGSQTPDYTNGNSIIRGTPV